MRIRVESVRSSCVVVNGCCVRVDGCCVAGLKWMDAALEWMDVALEWMDVMCLWRGKTTTYKLSRLYGLPNQAFQGRQRTTEFGICRLNNMLYSAL